MAYWLPLIASPGGKSLARCRAHTARWVTWHAGYTTLWGQHKGCYRIYQLVLSVCFVWGAWVLCARVAANGAQPQLASALALETNGASPSVARARLVHVLCTRGVYTCCAHVGCTRVKSSGHTCWVGHAPGFSSFHPARQPHGPRETRVEWLTATCVGVSGALNGQLCLV